MIDKAEQRRRAAELDAEKMKQGLKPPKVEWPTSPKKPATAPAWPFDQTPPPLPTTQTKNGLVAETFVNSLGQKISVGQAVVAVASGYNHAIRIMLGKYIGCRYNDRGQVRSVTVEVNHPRTGKIRRTTLPSKRIYPTMV